MRGGGISNHLFTGGLAFRLVSSVSVPYILLVTAFSMALAYGVYSAKEGKLVGHYPRRDEPRSDWAMPAIGAYEGMLLHCWRR